MEQDTLNCVRVIAIYFQTVRMLFGILELAFETVNLKPQCMSDFKQCR